jgi:hypothetical protein
MAYFAELNDENKVIGIIFINNDDMLDDSGVEQESIGLEICRQSGRGYSYVQTSMNTIDDVHIDPESGESSPWLAIRKNRAEIGGYYVPEADIFIGPKPKPWFVFDGNDGWTSPLGIGPNTGLPFTQDELDYICHLENTNTFYSLVPVVSDMSDDLAGVCKTTEYRIADIGEITHGVNPHTWMYLDEEGTLIANSYHKEYSVELDLSPIAMVVSVEMHDDHEMSNVVAKFCYEQHPHNEAFSIHELFRLIIEWAFAYTDLGNAEPMAKLSHDFLRAVQMPLEVRNAIIENVEPQVVGLYLLGSDIYGPFYRTHKIEAPQEFIDWYASISGNYPNRTSRDPLNVDLDQIPADYPR